MAPRNTASVTAPAAASSSTSSSKALRAPSDVPHFKVSDLRRAIPEHCFERSFVTSTAYLVADMVAVAVLFSIARALDGYLPEDAHVARAAFWAAYWVAQGCVMTGLWVIGHECGHGGYSDSNLVNDAFGLVIHSALLVPYFSWKISHRRHHSNTGNVARDEVFVPKHAEEFSASDSVLLWSAPGRALQIVITLTVGWFLYLGCNIAGRPYPNTERWVNHFSPWSPIFSAKERSQIVLSDIFLGAAIYGIYAACQTFGFSNVLFYYLVPYFVVNFWLVLITLLQHTDETLPHYTGDEWDWLRGALATVDRDYGFCNILHHHIGDTHVAHHLFSTMPHYHAQEATEALKAVLGDYYRRSEEPIASALWRAYRECAFVREEDGRKGVLWFTSADTLMKEATARKSE